MLALAAGSLASLALAAATAQRAVGDALAVPGARVELVGLRDATPRGCAPLGWSAPRPVAGSGPVALRFDGRLDGGGRCEGWAWAEVKVYATALRLIRDVATGEPLAGAVEAAEVEVAQGRRTVRSLPAGAAATRTLRIGTLLAASDLRVGPAPGDPVSVLVRAGALELTLSGRAATCGRDSGPACAAALLPGGRRLEGRWDGARIEVEAP